MFAFLKLVPTSVWIGLAAAVALLGLVWAIDHRGEVRGAARVQAAWDADKLARERATALANAELADAGYQAKRKADALAALLEHEKEQAAAARAALANRKDAYVAPALTKSCPDVPRGYLLWRSAAAAYANGADFPPAPNPSDLSLAFPSGVSLGTLSDTDLAQAAAFRDALQWGNGWKQYAANVGDYCDAVIAAAKGRPSEP